MKKLLIGMAVGAAALGATVVPASAVSTSVGGVVGPAPDESIWELLVGNNGDTEADSYGDAVDLDGTSTGFSDLVLIAGLGATLDTCGNGKPQFTLFAPAASILTYLLGETGMHVTMVELASSPDVVKAILADHLVNGSFSPEQLALSKRLVARSGYVLNIQNIDTVYGSLASPTAAIDDYYVNGNQVILANDACNGWLYTLLGFINSKTYIVSEGMNALDTPQDGTPGGTNSLPNTL